MQGRGRRRAFAGGVAAACRGGLRSCRRGGAGWRAGPDPKPSPAERESRSPGNARHRKEAQDRPQPAPPQCRGNKNPGSRLQRPSHTCGCPGKRPERESSQQGEDGADWEHDLVLGRSLGLHQALKPHQPLERGWHWTPARGGGAEGLLECARRFAQMEAAWAAGAVRNSQLAMHRTQCKDWEGNGALTGEGRSTRSKRCCAKLGPMPPFRNGDRARLRLTVRQAPSDPCPELRRLLQTPVFCWQGHAHLRSPPPPLSAPPRCCHSIQHHDRSMCVPPLFYSSGAGFTDAGAAWPAGVHWLPDQQGPALHCSTHFRRSCRPTRYRPPHLRSPATKEGARTARMRTALSALHASARCTRVASEPRLSGRSSSAGPPAGAAAASSSPALPAGPPAVEVGGSMTKRSGACAAPISTAAARSAAAPAVLPLAPLSASRQYCASSSLARCSTTPKYCIIMRRTTGVGEGASHAWLQAGPPCMLAQLAGKPELRCVPA